MIRKILLALTLMVFVCFGGISSVVAFSNVESLAYCLADHKFTMYGAESCSACNAQIEYFGESFKNVPYVDCSQNQVICSSNKITGYPTWVDRNGKKYSGVIPLELLAVLSDCSEVKTPERLPVLTLSQIIASFLAGLLSFLAPCLLPLFPTFLSVITGFTFAQLYGLDFAKIRPRIFLSTLFFVCGFSLVYTILGATGSIIGQILDQYLTYLLRVSGAILIGLGLLQIGVIKINALEFDYAWKVQRQLAKLGYLTAVVAGIAAALSWIPCVGPLLSPILLLAAESKTVGVGALLLFIYSLGLTTPFILGGLFFPFVYKFLQEQRLFLHRLSQFAGILLIVFGIILLAGQYQQIIERIYINFPILLNSFNFKI